MERDVFKTETLARLYLQQGHPEQAAPIYERLLAEEPSRASAVEGLERCRAVLRARRAEEGMDRDKRLRVLKELLARLTGTVVPEEPVPSRPVASPGLDLRERKILILRSMLQRLEQRG